ncbi:MAG TPA: AraC family transcriptional regulator [Verrucomicrobiae bacterium]|jgi:AraC-like DNA-binding protein|nr:AraC family transcriptional regulator [Verrucomicrobiae bacterium]
MSALKTALRDFVASRGDRDGVFLTPVNQITVMRNSKGALPQHAQHVLYTPALCVVVQGAKQITIGADVFDYGEGTALIVSVELPASGRVTRASSETPYLGMTIEFDINLMREVMEELETPPTPNADGLGAFIENLSDPLQDCVLRLARLLATPEAVPALYPAIMREFYYWLLTGPNAGEICKVVRRDSHTRRIADAIYFLRKNFARQVRVEEMANAARMSASSFHEHFKTLTALTPVQFQKQLRLLEARKLMVTQAANVTSAAYQVGYESLSQFSREYTRMFGTPPKRDVETLKNHVVPL